MALLRIGVMQRVMAWGLDQVDTLEQGNDGAVFSRRAVRPFVDLIRVDPEDDHQPDPPGEHATHPSHGQNRQSKAQQQPRTLKPSMTREIARVMVMQNIWLCDEPAGNGPVLVAIRVLEPVEEA